MTWEHKHIAKAKLEKSYPGELVTLRQLLHLDQIADVPRSWPDSNYDFFWIVDYAPNNPVPTGFRTASPGLRRALRSIARQRLGRAGAATHTGRLP